MSQSTTINEAKKNIGANVNVTAGLKVHSICQQRLKFYFEKAKQNYLPVIILQKKLEKKHSVSADLQKERCACVGYSGFEK